MSNNSNGFSFFDSEDFDDIAKNVENALGGDGSRDIAKKINNEVMNISKLIFSMMYDGRDHNGSEDEYVFMFPGKRLTFLEVASIFISEYNNIILGPAMFIYDNNQNKIKRYRAHLKEHLKVLKTLRMLFLNTDNLIDDPDNTIIAFVNDMNDLIEIISALLDYIQHGTSFTEEVLDSILTTHRNISMMPYWKPAFSK